MGSVGQALKERGHTAERTSEGESCWELHLTISLPCFHSAWPVRWDVAEGASFPGSPGAVRISSGSVPPTGKEKFLGSKATWMLSACLGRRSALQRAQIAPGMTGVQTAAQQLWRSPEDPVQHSKRQLEHGESSPKDKILPLRHSLTTPAGRCGCSRSLEKSKHQF